jgi:hypothetical protein
MRPSAGGGAAKNQGRPSSTNGGNRKGAATTTASHAIAINNNASRANNSSANSGSNNKKAPPSSSSPVSYAAKLSSSGGSPSAAGSPNRRPSTAAPGAPAKRDNAVAATATAVARPASKSPSSSSSGAVGGGGEEDVRAWLHAKLESTFGLDASVYGSYLEGFLQSEPSSGTTSDEDARDAIREVLLAAALDQVRTRHAGHTATDSDRHTLTNVCVRAQEGLVEEFIDQLMQRWADRPKGAVKVASNGTTSYSAAVSPPATTAAARKPSKQRKTKPQVSFYLARSRAHMHARAVD